MATHALVSYDASPPDHDALGLAAMLRDAGASLALAYVRHAEQARADRELLEDVGAEGRLREGARRLGDPDCGIHVVTCPSTAHGLGALATRVGADLLVFGSEHRTAPGQVTAGRAAATLMENGPTALALAPAGFAGVLADGRTRPQRIGILPGTADEAAIETAYALAESCDAVVTDAAGGIDLLVVGSRPHAREGHVLVSASAAAAIDAARAPVLVTARGVPLSFAALVTA